LTREQKSGAGEERAVEKVTTGDHGHAQPPSLLRVRDDQADIVAGSQRSELRIRLAEPQRSVILLGAHLADPVL
jgi:hypothetical protein